MTIQETMRNRVRAAINRLFDIDLPEIPVEVPPRTELGDLAFPVAFELAKRLKAATGQKQNPRDIANRLADVRTYIVPSDSAGVAISNSPIELVAT